MAFPSNKAPKAKTFFMAKEAFLNALNNAKRCSRTFKKKHSEQPDERDKTLLTFIDSVVRSFPKDAEEIPMTREKIMSRKHGRDTNIPGPAVASSVISPNVPIAPATTEPSNVLPDTFLNTTTPTPLSSPSVPAPTLPLTHQSRTEARRPIPEAIEVIVEVSATGQGKHTIWRYPGDEPRLTQAAPTTPTAAPACASLPGVIVKPSATGLGTHTIWLDTADPAPGQTESEAALKATVELHDLSDTPVTPSKRNMDVPDPRSSSPSASSRLIRSQKYRARHRSPTPYPRATRPAPPPPMLNPEAPEYQKSKKRSRDGDSEEETTRPRKRVSQESIASSSPSVTCSRTPLSTQGSPAPRCFGRRGRSSKRIEGKDDLKDN